MTKSPKETRIFAYGFDAIGYETPRVNLTLNNIGEIEFIEFTGATSLDTADGVIIPQGIFEKIETSRDFMGSAHTEVQIYETLLLERERQVFNLLKEGKWVCFLVGEIIDHVPQGYNLQDIKDTDLCKRVLNVFSVHRRTVKGETFLDTKRSEFVQYIRDYGTAKTVLELPGGQDVEMQVIAKAAKAGDHVVGVEFSGNLFFLPFLTAKKDPSTAELIVTTVAQAIIDYRQKRIVEIPTWADEFQFESEKKLHSEIGSLLEQENKLQHQLQSWRSYKVILTTSGDVLKNKVVRILEDFFHLKVDPIDENKEDAKIIDKDGRVLVMIEVKGTKGGVKREYVNQVDSHRERNALPSSIPGVLFINNEMSVSGIDKRLETQVSDEQIKHARNLNVLIVRTIDLLFLMRHLEEDSNRKDMLMKLLLSGGGWLRVDSRGYKVVSDVGTGF